MSSYGAFMKMHPTGVEYGGHLRLVPTPVDGLRAGEVRYTELETDIYDRGFTSEELLAVFIGAHGVKSYLEPDEPSLYPKPDGASR